MDLFKQLPVDWQKALEFYIDFDSLHQLEDFLEEEYLTQEIFPCQEELFKAFEYTPFYSVKALILGQDPYHNKGQMRGLAFSVPNDIRRPPSLCNILTEYQSDLGYPPPVGNLLANWAREGVLLMNAVLSVRAHTPCSHAKKGWEPFSDAVIRALSDRPEPLVFILWGGFARKKTALINAEQNGIVTSAHPSPLSAYRGFFGSKPFSRTNQILATKGVAPINWKLL